MPPPTRRPGSPDAFATLLRGHRTAAGLTQAELADRAGVGERTVSNLERAINSSPYPSTVRLLADALGLTAPARAELVGAARGIATTVPGAGSTVSPTGGYLGARPVSVLVARDGERARLTAALDSVTAGSGRTVLVVGEPGIGKTRLAQELSVDAGDRGFLVAHGRCYEPQAGAPFFPFLEALAALHDAAPRSVRESIPSRWPALAPLLLEAFPVESAGSRSGPDAAERLQRAVAGFVRELATLRPVALLLDDLHWADGASLDLLAHLVRHTRADRVLVAGAHRAADMGGSHPLRELSRSLRREGLVDTIRVERLDFEGTSRQISERLDGAAVSEEFAALVHRQTDGNPFFTVELLTALIERGALSRIDGRWIRRELSELEAPASVSDAIGERVSRLAPDTQLVLRAMSALGEVVDAEDLGVTGVDDETLERCLDDALASGLLTVVEGRYAFDHALTRQTLYAGLSPTLLRRLHRRAGEDLERRPAPARRRRASEISHHLELGGAPERAAAFAVLAGETAAGAHSHLEAVRHFRHALDLAEEVEDAGTQVAAREGLGHALIATARYDEALGHLDRAAAAHREAGDEAAWFGVEGAIAEARYRQGRGDVAVTRLVEVIDGLGAPLDEGAPAAGLAALWAALARVRLALGEYELCAEAAAQAARLARLEGSLELEADAETARGVVLQFLDQPDESLAALERAAALAERADALAMLSDALLALAWADTMRGSYERALVHGERGVEVSRRTGNRDAEAHHMTDLGLTCFYRGDWPAAERHLQRAVDTVRAGDPTLFSGIPPLYLGLLRRGQGDLGAAEDCYEEAAKAPDLATFAFDGYLAARRAELDLLRGDPTAALDRLEPWVTQETPTRIHDPMLLVTAAEACADLGDGARAQQLAERATRRASAIDNRVDAVDAERVRGRALTLQGRYAEARTCLDEALARARELPHPAAEARTLRDLGRWALAQARPAEARRHLAAAQGVLTSIGAVRDAAAVGSEQTQLGQ